MKSAVGAKIQKVQWISKFLGAENAKNRENEDTQKYINEIKEIEGISQSPFSSPIFSIGKAKNDTYISQHAKEIVLETQLENVTEYLLKRVSLEPDGVLAINNRLVLMPAISIIKA